MSSLLIMTGGVGNRSRCVVWFSNGGMDSCARISMGCTLVKEEVGFVSGMTFTKTTSNYYYITRFWSTRLTVLYDTDGAVHLISVGC